MNSIVIPCYQTELASFCQFRCPCWHEAFDKPIPPAQPLLVFPREAVRITHVGCRPVVANLNVVMFYNRGQEYRRDKISEKGDRSDFFRVKNSVVVQSVSRFDPSVVDHPEQPFRFSHGLISDQLFMRQRRLMELALLGAFAQMPDAWSEIVLSIIDGAIEQAYSNRGLRPLTVSKRVAADRRQLVGAAQEILSRNFQTKLSLGGIAASLNCSPYFLSRIFREYTGITVHQYQLRIRLRTAVERIQYHKRDLTELALELGFSSHSHFTAAFHRAYDHTPSQWRNQWPKNNSP